MAQQAVSNTTRDERISIRVSARERSMIAQAAAATGKTMTAFLLDAGRSEAERTLADQRTFLLDSEQWEKFSAALNRPVVEKSRLRALLETPGVLD